MKGLSLASASVTDVLKYSADFQESKAAKLRASGCEVLFDTSQKAAFPRSLVVFDSVLKILPSTDKSSGGLKLAGRILVVGTDQRSQVKDVEFCVWGNWRFRRSVILHQPTLLIDAAYRASECFGQQAEVF